MPCTINNGMYIAVSSPAILGINAMRVAKPVQLSADDDRLLQVLSNRKRIEARIQMRARIVLLATAAMSDKDIAQKLTDRRVAARWRARFLAAGMDGLLQDATRPGRPRTAREAGNVEEVVRITLEETPAGATHWSTRTLAEYLGTNASTVARIWRAHGLKPHRVESFKLSNDPHFIEKLQSRSATVGSTASASCSSAPKNPIAASSPSTTSQQPSSRFARCRSR